MKTRIVIAGAAWLVANAALAADMPSPAPAPVYRPIIVAPYNWTGVYIGANAGYGWTSTSAVATLSGNLAGVAGAISTAELHGPIAGGQIGAQYQAGWSVFGIEIDGQWSGQKTEEKTACVPGFTCTESAKINAFATARARLGVANDRTLAYVTGGAAWTRGSHTASVSGVGLSLTVFDATTSKVGWTVGAGIEGAFAGNWSIKTEYLYISTSDATFTGSVPLALGGGTITETVKLQNHILRVGVNYLFNAGPVVARY